MLVQTYGTVNFQTDIQRGKIGEAIFIDDFLKFLRINYEDVTGVQGFQVIDSDFLAKIGRYEIKANYKDDKMLVIEEFTNINESIAPKSFGWFYKSRADVLVFISKATRAMVIVPFTDEFKAHYEAVKSKYALRWNEISVHNGRRWQSAYRKVPLDDLVGYFAYYKKVQHG